MSSDRPLHAAPIACVCAATLAGICFAVSGAPLLMPVFGILVLVTVLSMREAVIMPGSLFICFFTGLMIIAPYFDLRQDVLPKLATDLYPIFPEEYLLVGLVALTLVMLVVHVLSVTPDKVRRMRLCIRRITAVQLLIVLGLDAGSELVLFLLGAGRHTAGFNDIPFVGVLNMIKTLPELLIAVAAFNAVGRKHRGGYVFVIVTTLSLAVVTSLLSGRKEDLIMSGCMAAAGFWASVRSPGRFLLSAVVPVLLVCFVFLPFMYRLRAHPAFNRMDQTSTPIEIVEDTIEGKYAPENTADFLQRMDLLEPTARYFGRNQAPMYDAKDIALMLACDLVPRFLWPGKPYEQPQLGYQFAVSYGYTSDLGITSIAFGYLVELHFLLGPAGVLLLVLLPLAFNSGANISLLGMGRVWPWVWLWCNYKFAVFVERTLLMGIMETLPYLALAIATEAALQTWHGSIRRRLGRTVAVGGSAGLCNRLGGAVAAERALPYAHREELR